VGSANRRYISRTKQKCAAKLFGASKGLRERINNPHSPQDQKEFVFHLNATEEALGEQEFSEFMLEGERLSTDEAIELALSVK